MEEAPSNVDKMKLTIVGNCSVGKSAILSALNNQYTKEYGHSAKLINGRMQDIIVLNGKQYIVEVHETNGKNEDYKKNLSLYYDNTRCIIICYDITSRDSYKNVTEFWMKEIQQYAPNAKLILAATKTDLRTESENCLTKEDGEILRDKIKADKYIECSGKTKVGVEIIFKQAICTLLDNTFEEAEGEEKSQSCNLQ